MGEISFQGRSLSRALDVWERMLQDRTTILLGLAGAMVPAGMRRIISFFIEHRLVDCIVSTGANLFHDIHETLGRYHWLGDANVDDRYLKDLGIDRIYDTYAVEDEFYQADRFIMEFGASIDTDRSYGTRSFLELLGQYLDTRKKEPGILTSAANHGVPVYCPAIGDSSIGIALSILSEKEGIHVIIDPIIDVTESAKIVIEADKTGVVYVGGGTPKNFIQQTEVTATYLGGGVEGHTYALQFIVDAPYWGGLSGCTFEEAQSWGKVKKDARMVTSHVDATIALPLIASALADDDNVWKGRSVPDLQSVLK
jgi:deoxyhypusine synthase